MITGLKTVRAYVSKGGRPKVTQQKLKQSIVKHHLSKDVSKRNSIDK
jgi:hypothetical protein